MRLCAPVFDGQLRPAGDVMIRLPAAFLALFFATSAWAEEVNGLIEPIRSAELRTEVDGVVKTLQVSEGDVVQAGDTLLSLASAVQQARVALAAAAASEARIAQADIVLSHARSAATRIAAAAKRGAAPKWEVRQANNRVAEAEAERRLVVDLAAADDKRLALEQAVLAQHSLRAPFAGMVTELQVAEGETATRSAPVLVLTDFSEMEATVFVPVDLLAGLKAGRAYSATLGAPVNRDVEAELTYIEPRIDPASQTAKAVFVFDNSVLNAPASVDFRIDIPANTK